MAEVMTKVLDTAVMRVELLANQLASAVCADLIFFRAKQ
jgi:hypothetical protein